MDVVLISKVSRAIGLADSIANPIFPLESSKPGSMERIAEEIRDTLKEVRDVMLAPVDEGNPDFEPGGPRYLGDSYGV